MRSRPWSWLRGRITALLDTPPTLTFNGRSMTALPATRIGWVLNPPTDPSQE